MKRGFPSPDNNLNQIDRRRSAPIPPPPCATAVKAWEECGDGGMDELLAVLGYKVRSSDMAEVAQRIEQLEEAMSVTTQSNDEISDIGKPDSVHYNPSDLSNWLDSMLSEVSPPPPDFGDVIDSFPSKRTRIEAPSTFPAAAQQQVVVVDSQENGIRLVHTLMACAEAINSGGLSTAEALVNQINLLASSQAGAMRKVATHFAQALAHRIYGLSAAPEIIASADDYFLQMHFYESSPYLKFAHFTANQAILEAFHGKPRVHIVDLSIGQGMQWPALIQALALRPEGPPELFRLTGIGPLDDAVGWKLAQFAETIGVEFEYRGFVANSLADLSAGKLDLRRGESVAVNSVFELHKVLALPGAIEKVLSAVSEMKPEIVTIVEQEANHNGPDFLDRFTESLHYYSTMFDSLEGSTSPSAAMAEVYLGRQIANVVASEGSERVERHETMEQWRNRLGSAGFQPAHLGSNAFKQASMLLALYAAGDGYGVEENRGSLTLGWHSRPIIATSAWKPGGSARLAD